MPSPVKRSSVASCSSTRRPIAAWNEPSVRMSSSGSVVSANAVKPRRSQYTTTISRRRLFSGSSPLPSTIISASLGEKKRFRRDSRSFSATCSATRRSSVALQSASCAACRCVSSCRRLMRSSDCTRAKSSGWLIGLPRKSSAPAAMPLIRSCLRIERGAQHDRQQRRRRIGADAAAHVVARHARASSRRAARGRAPRRRSSRAPPRRWPPS